MKYDLKIKILNVTDDKRNAI